QRFAIAPGPAERNAVLIKIVDVIVREEIVVALADQNAVALVEHAPALANVVVGDLDIVRLFLGIFGKRAADAERNVADAIGLADLDASRAEVEKFRAGQAVVVAASRKVNGAAAHVSDRA